MTTESVFDTFPAGPSSTWSSTVLRTTDVDDAVSQIATLFSPHSIEVVGPGRDFDVEMNARFTDAITVAEISHGTEVVVRPGRLDSYYHVNLPLSGYAVCQSGPVEVIASPDHALVLGPAEEPSMRWSADCAQLAVKINKNSVERCIESVLGYPPDESVEFSVGLDTTRGAGRDWLREVRLLRDAADRGYPALVLRPLEELVVGQLLTAQPNNFSGRLAGDPRPVRPRTVSRVLDFIEADPASPHTVADMARVAGISVRSLQAAFAEHLGLTPMEYLRRVRLARAHHDLLTSEPHDARSVADIAYRWGFGHVSRFAATYTARYGQSPATTLRS